MAQGPVVTGGFAAGRRGATQTVNHPTVGRSPNGATVERPAPSVTPKSVVRLQLQQADFTTAMRIADAVNLKFGSNAAGAKAAPAQAENAGLVSVAIPPAYADRATAFLSELENLTVEADRPARVVINERTGTIIFGKDVHIAPVAILHGNLNVEIQTIVRGLPASAALQRNHRGGSPDHRRREGREGPQRAIEAGGHGRGPGARAGGHRISTPRDVIAILQSLRTRRRAGSRHRGDVIP